MSVQARNKLLILGAGGHGKVCADIALHMQRWDEIAFLDDNPPLQNPLGLKVLGIISEVDSFLSDYEIFVAIGNNKVRGSILTSLQSQGAAIATLIHPCSVIGAEVEVGKGTAIMAGAVINCCTRIGTGCIINTGATIDHDNVLEDDVHVSPGVHLAGTVFVGQYTWIGIGAVVINNVSIAQDIVVGAGAAVIHDLVQSGTYIGIPARK